MKSEEKRLPSLEVVVPCYNEYENLPLLVEHFEKVVPGEAIRVLFVDNGSTDGSLDLLKKLCAGKSFARVLRVEKNQGYGFGIIQGLKAADAMFVGWTHADLQTDPADIVRAWHILRERNYNPRIYVKGLRKKRPLLDSFFTWGMGVFETIYLRAPLWDINGQPNIFSKEFFLSWENPPHDFALDLFALYTAKKNGFEIVRFPVVFPERVHGESKWNTGLGAKWNFIKRTISFSAKLKASLKK